MYKNIGNVYCIGSIIFEGGWTNMHQKQNHESNDKLKLIFSRYKVQIKRMSSIVK